MSAVRPIIRPILRQAIRSVFQGGAFDPVSLFASGEQGAWYDPTLPERELGADEVVNGTFDVDSVWVKDAGWTISGGVASCNTGGSVIKLAQNSVASSVAGKWVKIGFDVTSYTSGSVAINFTATGQLDLEANSSGSYEAVVYVPASSSTFDLRSGTSGFVGSVDNVTVKEVTNYSQWLSATTLYQDSAGTLPVQNDGDPVGLMLDKSQGLVRGPEKATGDLTTWNFTNVSGLASVTATTFNFFDSIDRIILTPWSSESAKPVGFAFNVKVSVSGTGDFRVIALSGNGTTISSDVITLTGSPVDYEFTFINEVAGTSVGVGFYGNAGATEVNCTVSSVSVKEFPGNHATQDTGAAKRLYRTDGTLHWLEDDLFDDALNVTMPDLGTNATLAYADGAGVTILTGQTISGAITLPAVAQTYGVIYLDRPFTADETTQVTDYLNALRGA